jgi:uncharacterized protein HemX
MNASQDQKSLLVVKATVTRNYRLDIWKLKLMPKIDLNIMMLRMSHMMSGKHLHKHLISWQRWMK